MEEPLKKAFDEAARLSPKDQEMLADWILKKVEARLGGHAEKSGSDQVKLISVDSSMVRAVGYDAASHELEVVFNTGRIYCYQRVPRRVFKALLAAESKGQYMRANVIDCYPYHQVSGRKKRR